MGLNIGLYLRRSEVTATEVRGDRYGLPTKKGTKGICLCKQEMHVEDSSRAFVTQSVFSGGVYWLV
jgi:hypothetical protein